jgi:O-antigen ligase
MDQEKQRGAAKLIDRAIIALLFVFAAFAPHSIAVTQGAWLVGMLLWIVRFAFYPPPRLFRTPLDYALLGFFILTGISTVFSYEPLVSLGKVRAAALFTIVYLVAENVPSLRVVRLLVLTLIASTVVNVLFVTGLQIVGVGLRVEGVQADSPLSSAMSTPRTTARPVPILSGDTVFEVDGKKISTAEELAAALSANPQAQTARVKIFRLEWTPTLEVTRGRLLLGNTAEQQLGISGWSRGRDWRATGFFGNFVTYAESLQLLASLALGIFLVYPKKRSRWGLLLLLAVAGLVWALALTVTRASWAAFLFSAALMLFISSSRRAVLVFGACVIPLVIVGALFLQQKRSVGFLDAKDLSTTWRATVWREGFNLLVSKPRHLIVGIGMDSIKSHWRQWGLFDQGRIPWGHMHSNPLQLALERGVPAFLTWLWLLFGYALMLWRLLRANETNTVGASRGRPFAPPSASAQRATAQSETNSKFEILNSKFERGILLGALGGLAGFLLSGLVHYNWGDSEVVMILYFIMGLSLVIYAQKSPA